MSYSGDWGSYEQSGSGASHSSAEAKARARQPPQTALNSQRPHLPVNRSKFRNSPSRGDPAHISRRSSSSTLPHLTGSKKQPPHEMLFWRRGQHYAARKGNIKLVKMDGGDELYDLASDIGESRDLSSQRPEVLEQMKKAYEKWNSQMIEPLWTRQPTKRKKTAQKRKKS